eukprot:Blabericola_migrator_1__426@NODE_1101_length_5433_cov_95_739657_g754_i0_p2_GENE_NODE_1101_length_5433_cov_95_739657_g754_i0NODE_1101_length_5433_cov_95_739657_g754_i0_p2_ORF_typecomplete_len625_score74_30PWI/PF01480_17/5_6e20_NODE_1101_length_5433_cov_95_739657_g754_i034135287
MAGTGPGFYRGTTHEQTPFFENKEAKMLEEYEWPRYFKKGVDFNKVSLDVIKYWISKQVTTILGFEDDIVIDFVLQQLLQEPDPQQENMLADSGGGEGDGGGDDEQQPGRTTRCVDPRKLTFSLTGFMKEQAFPFVSDLWRLLLSAQENPQGIPKEFAEAQEQERQSKLKEAEKIRQELAKLQAQQNGTAADDNHGQDEEMPDKFNDNRRDRSHSPLVRSRRRRTSRSPSLHYEKRRRRSPGRWSPPPRRHRRGDDWNRYPRDRDWERGPRYRGHRDDYYGGFRSSSRRRDDVSPPGSRDVSLSPPPRRRLSHHKNDMYEGLRGSHGSSSRSNRDRSPRGEPRPVDSPRRGESPRRPERSTSPRHRNESPRRPTRADSPRRRQDDSPHHDSSRRPSESPRRTQRSISPRGKQRSVSPRSKQRSISPRRKQRSISPRRKQQSISPRKQRSISPRKQRSISPRSKQRSISPRKQRSISPRPSPARHRRSSMDKSEPVDLPPSVPATGDIIIRRHRNCYMDEVDERPESSTWKKLGERSRSNQSNDSWNYQHFSHTERQRRLSKEEPGSSGQYTSSSSGNRFSKPAADDSGDEKYYRRAGVSGRTCSEERLRRLALRKVKGIKGSNM